MHPLLVNYVSAEYKCQMLEKFINMGVAFDFAEELLH